MAAPTEKDRDLNGMFISSEVTIPLRNKKKQSLKSDHCYCFEPVRATISTNSYQSREGTEERRIIDIDILLSC